MLNTKKILAALEEDGAIANRLPLYEKRASQLDLMRLLIQGFNDDALIAAEAGTGVGKSFAYLLPAISFALENEERVVISTATITLQQQLFEKDIPLVLSALNKNIKTALIKGRGNYVCLRRLADAKQELSDGTLSGDEGATDFSEISAWAETSKTGNRSDLPFVPAAQVWSRICSDSEACMGKKCPLRESCFIMEKRREAAAAKILVVNHHLLFADLAARQNGAGYEAAVVLPPYTRVIIDEAHTIEGAATSFFSSSLNKFSVVKLVRQLWRQRGIVPSGILARLVSRSSAFDEGKIAEFGDIIRDIQDKTEELNQAALKLCGDSGVFRLSAQKNGAISGILVPPLDNLAVLLFKLIKKGGVLAESFENAVLDKDFADPDVWELRAALAQVQNAAALCNDFIEFEAKSGDVFWLERRHSPGADWAQFNCAPISVAGHLKEALFDTNSTVICLSATMTVSGSFNFWNDRSGIAGGTTQDGTARPLLTGIFPSPFPYASSVLLAVPADAPQPSDPRYQNFVDNAVAALAGISGGSSLVLFTSFDSLRRAYEAASPALEAQGIHCLKQGDEDRSRLLRTFIDDESSVLFATDSFWEGVDAPGDTLRLVILCKLPFTLPNDPVFEARCEAVEKRGGNAFMELSVPESIMKFRQGFGRLIRRSSDRGVVAVLDNRLLHKRYGQLFLQSLPKTKTCFDTMNVILRETETMLFST